MEVIGDAYYDVQYEREVQGLTPLEKSGRVPRKQSLTPLIFKYFKVWEKPTGVFSDHDVGPGEEVYDEVGREEISKDEYEEKKAKLFY